LSNTKRGWKVIAKYSKYRLERAMQPVPRPGSERPEYRRVLIGQPRQDGYRGAVVVESWCLESVDGLVSAEQPGQPAVGVRRS